MKSDYCLVAACIFIMIAKSIQLNQAMTECLLSAWFKLLVTSDLNNFFFQCYLLVKKN